jgi:hypothetical protein
MFAISRNVENCRKLLQFIDKNYFLDVQSIYDVRELRSSNIAHLDQTFLYA